MDKLEEIRNKIVDVFPITSDMSISEKGDNSLLLKLPAEAKTNLYRFVPASARMNSSTRRL